jgi:hypothetical protein
MHNGGLNGPGRGARRGRGQVPFCTDGVCSLSGTCKIPRHDASSFLITRYKSKWHDTYLGSVLAEEDKHRTSRDTDM